MNDISKEDGEISSDDDVLVVGFSKVGEDFTPNKIVVSSEPDVIISRAQPINTISSGKRLVRKSRQSSRRKSCYGLSASLNSARERLRNNQAPRIPMLMSIPLSPPRKFTGRVNTSPLSTSNVSVPSGYPPFPVNLESSQKSRTPVLSNLSRIKPLPREQRSQFLLCDSPASDLDERDYVDMLLEYKEIQKKLEVINQEEGRLVEEERNKENLNEGESKAATDSKSDAVSKLVNEEDDDLEILELRRKCLESLASVTEDRMPEQRNNSAQKSRQRLASYRRNKSPVRQRQSSSAIELSSKSQARKPSSPDHSSLKTGIQRLGRGPKRRRHSPDSEEFKKFVERLSSRPLDVSEDVKKKTRPAKRSGLDPVSSSSVGDNYDEVEMDLDSGCEGLEEPVTGNQRKFDGNSEEMKEPSQLPGRADSIAKSDLLSFPKGKNPDRSMFLLSAVGGLNPVFPQLPPVDLKFEQKNTPDNSSVLPSDPHSKAVLSGSSQVPGMQGLHARQTHLDARLNKSSGGNAWLYNLGVKDLVIDSSKLFYPIPTAEMPPHFPPRKESKEKVSAFSDSNDDDSENSEESLLRKLLLNDLAKKKIHQTDKEKNAPVELPSSRPAAVPLMQLSVRPVAREPIASAIQPPNTSQQFPRPLAKNQCPPSLLSHTRLRLPAISSESLSSSLPKSVLVPGASGVAHSQSVPTGRTVSTGSTSVPAFNAAFKMDVQPLKVTIPVPMKRTKTKTRVPMPQHKPVVISLSGDTDSDSADDDDESHDDSETTTTTARSSSSNGLSESLLGNLDNFLKEARHATELKKEENSFKSRITEECGVVKGSTDLGQHDKDIPDGNDNLRPEAKNADVQGEDAKGNDVVLQKSNLTRAATVAVSNSAVSSASAQLPKKMASLGLETWLMDGRKVELKLLARKISQLEKEINTERSQLQLEEHQMKKFELEMTRKRGQYRQSVIRVEKLREQLSATEKILTHNQEQIVVLGKKTQEIRSQTLSRKARLVALKKEMNEAGRRLCGGDPVSKSNHPLTPQKAVSLQSGSKDLAATKAQALMSARSLAAEKKHLEELAKKFEQLIESHKKKQAAKASTSIHKVGPSRVRKPSELTVEHIKTEEKMIFGAGSELYGDVVDIVPRRRKSLLDESPTTTKPVFGKAKFGEQSVSVGFGPATSSKTFDCDMSADDAKFSAIQSIKDGRICLVRKVLGDHLIKQAADDEFLAMKTANLKCSDPFLKLQPPVERISSGGDFQLPKATNQTESYSGRQYSSVLLCFRSYRFSPYYRTKEGRTVRSSAHKIDVNTQLCHFDLMGKCNDDKCPWQHEDDYRTSHKETLIDIASYASSVADLSDSTDVKEYPQMLDQFADQFIKLNSKLTDAEQSLRLLVETYKNTGLTAPNYILAKPRKWKLSPSRRAPVDLDDKKEVSLVPVKDRGNALVINEDDVIMAADVRYWMLETQEVEDIETAVADCPSNVQLWIKLAYKKMSDLKAKSKSEESLALGMHVLSRGLEVNQNSETLWRHYLHLFGKREDTNELMNFYQMALNCAPSYYLYWKFLELKSTYSEKMDACKSIRQFLCSPRCHDDRDVKSHHLLEIILFQAGLNIETGRLKAGREIVESVIQSKVSVIWLNLVSIDRIIIWLAYIHIVEFRKLPMSLYDPAASFPGPIVNKVPFSLPWSSNLKPRSTLMHLKKLVDDALQSCSNGLGESAASAPWLCELYRSKFYLEEEENGLEASIRLCREVLAISPHLDELWVFLIEKMSHHSGDQKDVREVISDALEQNPHSVSLHLASISFFLSQGDGDKALEYAERCALNLFDVQVFDTSADPNLLFCKLLDQTLPCTYQPPLLRSNISVDWINDRRSDIWLCYCLLLDLQGAHEQASEAYQTAISTIKDGSALGAFCLRFLRRCYGVLKGELPWSNSSDHTTSAPISTPCWLEFDGHVSRILQIVPSRFAFPHDPDQNWINFSVQNEIIDFYIGCLSDESVILKLYEKFINMMPTNVVLVRRACDFMLKKQHFAMCNGICSAALLERPKAVLLWNTKLLLAHQDGSIRQMRRDLRTATSNVPFSQKLWKNFMLFEVAQKNSDGVRAIVERCRQLQINIEESLNAALSTSRNVVKPPQIEIKNK